MYNRLSWTQALSSDLLPGVTTHPVVQLPNVGVMGNPSQSPCFLAYNYIPNIPVDLAPSLPDSPLPTTTSPSVWQAHSQSRFLPDPGPDLCVSGQKRPLLSALPHTTFDLQIF